MSKKGDDILFGELGLSDSKKSEGNAGVNGASESVDAGEDAADESEADESPEDAVADEPEPSSEEEPETEAEEQTCENSEETPYEFEEERLVGADVLRDEWNDFLSNIEREQRIGDVDRKSVKIDSDILATLKICNRRRCKEMINAILRTFLLTHRESFISMRKPQVREVEPIF